MINISIIGSGMVGTATGKGFKSKGNNVIFHDVSKERLIDLEKEQHHVSHSIEETICNTDVSFVCVPTPTKNGIQDISSLMDATENISMALEKIKKYHLVVFRSTMLPGTMKNSIINFLDKNCSKKRGKDFDVLYNPEFLREVSSIEDFIKPDRVIIGEDITDSSKKLRELYAPFTENIIITSFAGAEMIKYASNCFLSLKISFFNEIGTICKKMNIDDKVVSHGVSMDNRIGSYGVVAGKPFGGACLPKDTEAFANFVKKLGINPDLIKTALDINEEIKK